MKVVDTREYVSVLRELVREGKEVSMLITGSSMTPFLFHQKDTICFRSPDRALRKGDMVFYERKDGRFVMHRIYKVKPEGLYIVGELLDVDGECGGFNLGFAWISGYLAGRSISNND